MILYFNKQNLNKTGESPENPFFSWCLLHRCSKSTKQKVVLLAICCVHPFQNMVQFRGLSLLPSFRLKFHSKCIVMIWWVCKIVSVNFIFSGALSTLFALETEVSA